MISIESLRHLGLGSFSIILASHKPPHYRVRSVAVVLATVMSCVAGAYAQACPDPAPQTSGSYRFRRLGESISIPISVADCHPVALDLHWANGRNNGGLFVITFLDSGQQPIFTKQISGFMVGTSHFDLTSLAPQLALGSRSLLSLPSSVTIQTVRPFASPASISYVVTRMSPHPNIKYLELDESTASNLRTTTGKVLVEGESKSAPDSGESFKYLLEEVTLDEPRELEVNGGKEVVKSVFRLTLMGVQSFSTNRLIWLDDAPLPAFSLRDSRGIATLIYDRSVLQDGAQISVSNVDGSRMVSLAERLSLPATKRGTVAHSSEEGNEITSIHSAVRLVGATRQPLVQIELRTNRMFPPRDVPLQLMIGKQNFLNELSGNANGRSLTLTLTPQSYAALKEGAEVIAYYGTPDLTGFSGRDVWRFGRLKKVMSDQRE